MSPCFVRLRQQHQQQHFNCPPPPHQHLTSRRDSLSSPASVMDIFQALALLNKSNNDVNSLNTMSNSSGNITATFPSQASQPPLVAESPRPAPMPSSSSSTARPHPMLMRSVSMPVDTMSDGQNLPFHQQQPGQHLGVGGSTQATAAAAAAASRYKTEMCRPFEEHGYCKYGDKCQFAHGIHELRTVSRHPKYKTELCRTYHTVGFCAYGTRCHFLHDEDELQKTASGPPSPLTVESPVSTSSRVSPFAAHFQHAPPATTPVIAVPSAAPCPVGAHLRHQQQQQMRPLLRCASISSATEAAFDSLPASPVDLVAQPHPPKSVYTALPQTQPFYRPLNQGQGHNQCPVQSSSPLLSSSQQQQQQPASPDVLTLDDISRLLANLRVDPSTSSSSALTGYPSPVSPSNDSLGYGSASSDVCSGYDIASLSSVESTPVKVYPPSSFSETIVSKATCRQVHISPPYGFHFN